MLRRVALIQAGRAAGVPLEQIRGALATLPSHRTPTRRDWERLSIDRCSLLNPDDQAAALGPRPHYLERDAE